MLSRDSLLRFYKKHPVLATLIILAVVGLFVFFYVTGNKDSGEGGGQLTVVPAQTGTVTPAPATPTDPAKPTDASASPTVTPTTAPATPTQAQAPTNTPKPTKTPTPTVTPKPTKTPTPTVTPKPTKTPTPTPGQSAEIDEDGWYYDKTNVALYIHTYGHLPGNYITKKEAEDLGWSGGSIEKYAKGKAIGGDYFGNYEGHLPKKNGRKYYECDIDTKGAKSRGAKRIIFSNDGLIYYTDDHYETFTRLY